jgi:acetate kinase
MDTLLVVNAGSSSIKFQVFALESKGPRRLVKGQMDGIGTHPKLRAAGADGKPLIEKTYATHEVEDVPAALHTAAAWLRQSQNVAPVAVGHRVVHGGPDYDGPVLVDAEVLRRLDRYVSLAPLHQPNNLAPIRTMLARRPEVPQVACFDTAFHRGHGELADRYAIPQRLHDAGVRRYGFHGLSYEYIAGRLREFAPEAAAGRVVVAHLGSGASLCALAGGRSIESTMGFTALDGLPMGTRPGQLDPGVVLYLIEEKKMTAVQVRNMLYAESGLKGLSGISNDVRDLQASTDPRAHFALEYFVYRVALLTGSLIAALGGLDAFVFTAGIGENSPGIRARIVERLAWAGAMIDPVANAVNALLVSKAESRLPVYVLPTDEELMIARHTQSTCAKARTSVGAL